MAHNTRIHRRKVYRSPRYGWRTVRRGHVRRALQALDALYRKA